MSQVKNKVKWCLNKAKRELEEGKKHRGLVEVGPDIEEAKKHIKKAEHNFKVIIAMEKNAFSDWAVNAAFYCIYHCFLAMVSRFGYQSQNQECTIALIEHLKEQGKISISKEIIDSLKAADNEEKLEKSVIELRENFQYGTETEIDDEELSKLRDLCKQAIEETKAIIFDN